jgi:hypothetical protein
MFLETIYSETHQPKDVSVHAQLILPHIEIEQIKYAYYSVKVHIMQYNQHDHVNKVAQIISLCKM